jgi:hypothetical protein
MSTLELENIKHPDNSGDNIALASNGSITIDRKSTDGSIIEFRKDGTAVGSIGVESGDNLIVGGTVANHSGLLFGTNTVIPMQAGSGSDATQSLGNSGTRWKDAYLSDGIYLGGTGSANKLDDYEEGTWTPSNSNLATSSGRYVKVGSKVTIWTEITFSSSASGSTAISGLPFPCNNSSWAGNVAIHGTGITDLLFFTHNGQTSAYLRNSSNTDYNASVFQNDFLYCTATYLTDS